MSYSTGSKSLIRELNRSAVLNLIKSEGPIPRVAIAKRLGLSGAAVTSITGELDGLGLIREVAQTASTGGRPASLLALDPAAGSVIGVKLATDHLAGVIADLGGNVLDSQVVALRSHRLNSVMERIARLVSTLRHSVGGGRLLGVGIGMPGAIDGVHGVCVASPSLGWRAAPVADVLADRLQLPVLIDNDVNTLAIAERLYGLGRQADDFITVTIGRGVGLGIVIDGKLHRGRSGGAGEFGHLPIAPDGPICECGRRGCLEAMVGDPALVAQARAASVIGSNDDVQALIELAAAGDEAAQAIYERAGERLGIAIAGLVNVLSPSLVIVAGEGVRARQHVERSLRAAMADHIFPPLAGVELVIDPWDDAKWARGAASLVLETFFSAGRDDRANGAGVDLAGFAAEAG